MCIKGQLGALLQVIQNLKGDLPSLPTVTVSEGKRGLGQPSPEVTSLLCSLAHWLEPVTWPRHGARKYNPALDLEGRELGLSGEEH